jgi:hypothetical protein
VFTSLLPHSWSMFHSSHSLWFYRPNYTSNEWPLYSGVPHSSVSSSPLGPNIFLSIQPFFLSWCVWKCAWEANTSVGEYGLD